MEYQKYKQENSAAIFLQMAQKRLKEEIDRTKNFLHESSIPKITQVVEDTLVKNHMQEIIEVWEILYIIINLKRHNFII
jgi:Cullin family